MHIHFLIYKLLLSPRHFHSFSYISLITSLLFVSSTIGSLNVNDEFKHTYLDKFDIIKSTDIRETVLVTRDTGQDDTKPSPRKLSFTALGTTFRLILNQSPQLISPTFTIFTIDENGNKRPYEYDNAKNQILQGKLEGDPHSIASVTMMAKTTSYVKHRHKIARESGNEYSIQKGTIMATHIKTGNDLIVVEPCYLHQDSLKSSSSELSLNDTMIVYKLNDHTSINNSSANPFKPQAYCGNLDMSEYELSPHLNTSNKPLSNEIESHHSFRRTKRSQNYIVAEPQRKNRCSLLLVVDTLFYRHVGRQSIPTTVNYVLGLIDRVNKIYMNTTWSNDGDQESEPYNQIGFTVRSLHIHDSFQLTSENEKHYNMETDRTWGAKEFLENFSRHADSRWFCLAHLLTYRKFDSTVLGLAFVASARPGSIGGICSERYERDGFISYFNTGISTSLSISGETLITRQADLVVAHELGHNFGAEHDSQGTKCAPKSDKGGAYLMHAYSVQGFDRNNRIFSPCSRTSIWQVLRRKSHQCFSSLEKEYCGNGIVENGEECDGGDVGRKYEDQCCDSKCRLRPGATCSDRHSLCCQNCQITPATQICRLEEQFSCKQAAYCDGSNAECPKSPPADNGTSCTGTGECHGGECVPFCETKGLSSCLCENPNDACKLCCKFTDAYDQSHCRPYEYGSKLRQLADGTLCYRGICEKGRCEQQVQDVVERFWDVIEDINFSTVSQVLRDNIVLVALFISVPVWLIGLYLVERFDKLLMDQLTNEIDINTINNNTKGSSSHIASHSSAFLPPYFGDNSMPHQANPLSHDSMSTTI